MGTVCRTAIKQGEIGHTRIDDGVVKDRRTREQQFAVRGEVHSEFQPEELLTRSGLTIHLSYILFRSTAVKGAERKPRGITALNHNTNDSIPCTFLR